MGRRVSIAVAVTCASLLSVGLVGTALAAKDTYIGGGGSAEVKVRNEKQPKKVVRLDAFVQSDNCGNNTFLSIEIRDLRVRNDRFDGSKGEITIEGKFTKNANKFKATLTSDSGCEGQGTWAHERTFVPGPGGP